MSLFSSRKASPVFGFVLKRVVPVRMSFFFDFVVWSCSIDGKSCNTQGQKHLDR